MDVTTSALATTFFESYIKYDEELVKKGDWNGKEIEILTSSDISSPMSLSTQARLKYVWSDVLFPSNYPLRKIEDKGSIVRSLAEAKIDLFDRGEKISGLLSKISRCVTRAFVVQLIGITIAPIGFIYHGTSLIYHSIKWLKSASDRNEQVKRIKEQGQLTLDELGMMLFSAMRAVFFSPFVVAHFTPIPISELAFFGFYWLFVSMVPYGALIPTEFPIEQWKGLILKNNFGVVDQYGNLLTVSGKEDKEFTLTNGSLLEMKGHLTNLYIEKGVKLLDIIKELQLMYGDKVQELVKYPYKDLNFFDELQKESDDITLSLLRSEYEKIVQDIEELENILRRLFLEQFGMNHRILLVYPLSKRNCKKILNESKDGLKEQEAS